MTTQPFVNLILIIGDVALYDVTHWEGSLGTFFFNSNKIWCKLMKIY
jgi:hypothetical protein